MRTVRLYGRLGARFGRVHILAVESPGEAVRALCVRNPGFEAYIAGSKDGGVGYKVFVGKREVREEWINSPANDDIRIAPYTQGAKNGGILNIVLGVALIAASFFLPGSAVFLAGVFSAGVSIALGGVVMLLSPQPKDKNSKDKPENEPNYAFNGPVNTQAQGNPVPVLYGELIVGGAVISAGINVGDVYIPIATADHTIAQSLMSKYESYWPFDSDGVSVIGPTYYVWGCTYGGPGVLTPFYSSPLGNSAAMRGYGYAPHSNSLVGKSWVLHFWADVAIPAGRLMYVGLGEVYYYSTGSRATMKFVSDGSGNVTVRLTAFDYGPGVFATVESSAAAVPGGRSFFTLEYDGPTKTLKLTRANAQICTLPLTANAQGMDRLLVQDVYSNYSGEPTYGAFTPNTQFLVDEMGFIADNTITNAERSYLAAGKRWSDIVADASYAPPAGSGVSGGDLGSLWTRIIEGH